MLASSPQAPPHHAASTNTADTDGSSSLPIVSLRLGSLHIALEAARVQGMSTCPPDVPLPTLEALLGLPAPTANTHLRRCLHLRPNPPRATPVCLSVPAPLSLQQLPIHTIAPLPPLLATCCHLPGLRALAWHPEGLLLLLDVRRLLPAVLGQGQPADIA